MGGDFSPPEKRALGTPAKQLQHSRRSLCVNGTWARPRSNSRIADLSFLSMVALRGRAEGGRLELQGLQAALNAWQACPVPPLGAPSEARPRSICILYIYV